jgi:hypothetical protein
MVSILYTQYLRGRIIEESLQNGSSAGLLQTKLIRSLETVPEVVCSFWTVFVGTFVDNLDAIAVTVKDTRHAI